MIKIAIGIVLLPTEEIMDLCIAINKEAFKHRKGRFLMSKKDFVPHISLTLGCIDEEKLPEIIKKIELISQNQKPLELKLEGICLYQRDDGKRGTMKINISKELKNLHKNILDAVSDKLMRCDSADVLIEGNITGISATSKNILNNYKESHAYDKYNPHITLCSYDSDQFSKEIDFPIKFTASKIALFQIGDGCTCRRLIYSSIIKELDVTTDITQNI